MNELTYYNAAKSALATCAKVDEVKDVKDKAEAMRLYALQSHNTELELWAAEIKLRAVRRLGEISKELEKAKAGGAGGGTKVGALQLSKTETLKESGISKDQAYRAEAIAAIPEEKFEAFIAEKKAEGKAVTADEVVRRVVGEEKKRERRLHIEQQKEAIERGELPELEGLFDVIVIDPPWNYGREYDPDSSRVANPYPEMTIKELEELYIPANEDCVLFLWTTQGFLLSAAKHLLDAWGFEEHAILIWDKEKMGMGRWLRMQCEFCVIATRGNPLWENTTWRDIIREPRREHSRKPDIFYQMVEEITVGRRLDYFSRQKREGWEVFGNDTKKF